jgi:apolipoprotein D and lipocalin family protein
LNVPDIKREESGMNSAATSRRYVAALKIKAPSFILGSQAIRFFLMVFLEKHMAIITVLPLLASCALSPHGAVPETPPLQTVAQVDLNRYLGLWYEIGRYPNSFQKGCQGSTALYTARPDGEIDVLNSCRDERDNSLREAKGRAWVIDQDSKARLKVSFFWPFRGDYWIINLGQEYEYAVVGTPDRKYLWILSRTPSMNPEILATIIDHAEKQGFVRDKLLLP